MIFVAYDSSEGYAMSKSIPGNRLGGKGGKKSFSDFGNTFFHLGHSILNGTQVLIFRGR